MTFGTEPEAVRLRAVLRDLVALSAIPVVLLGKDPAAVTTGLADSLVDLLHLDFAFVRLGAPSGDGAVDAGRGGSAWPEFADWLEREIATSGPLRRKQIHPEVGDGPHPCRGLVVPVGVNGGDGVVALACKRCDFPTPMEELLLSLAINDGATAFQNARLLDERARVEEQLRQARSHLEAEVVARTAELGRLADEQAALRRVATLVARGGRPVEIFSAVSDEVAGLFETGMAGVVRFADDGAATVFVGVSKELKDALPIRTKWPVGDFLAPAEVGRTGRSARVDNADSSSGPAGVFRRQIGIVSTVASPIVVDGRLWGAITVAGRDALPPATEDRLEKFAELIATAVANAETYAQLTASRARIIATADEVRRRIERNLHDGVQQRLVSLGLELRAAQATVPRDLDTLAAELDRLACGLNEAFDEVRELSRGIHPAVLTDSGLKPALKALARRSAIPVVVNVPTAGRLPEQVEVAAYYVVSEALANAVKHSHASTVTVRVETRDGVLLVQVSDDGIGGAEFMRGSGLVGLSDRVGALGGRIEVRSHPGAGTSLMVELPLANDAAATVADL